MRLESSKAELPLHATTIFCPVRERREKSPHETTARKRAKVRPCHKRLPIVPHGGSKDARQGGGEKRTKIFARRTVNGGEASRSNFEPPLHKYERQVGGDKRVAVMVVAARLKLQHQHQI